MFRRIALLVLQEQVVPRNCARKWRNKVKKRKAKCDSSEEKTSKEIKDVMRKPLLRRKSSVRVVETDKLTTNKHKQQKLGGLTLTKDIYEEVMAEIEKFAKDGRKPPPEPIPNAICFDLGGSKASHAEIYSELKELALSKGDCIILSLQYLAMSFRWKVLLDSKSSRDRIAGSEINVNGRKILLRRYDDVRALEYKKYLRANGFLDSVKHL